MSRLLSFFSSVLLLTSASAITTNNDRIIGPDGKELRLKGVNYFGFQNGQTMVDGLYAGPDSISLDFATVVHRIRLLGFNAVRLPFSFKDLKLTPKDWRRSYCAIASSAQLKQSVTPPGLKTSKVIPPLSYPGNIVGKVCNSYVPTTSTRARFIWTVQFLAKNGFYVLIDNHLREDQTALHDPKLWAISWKQLVADISKDPVAKSHLLIDILNEPDNYGVRWEKTNVPGLKDLYISAMDAIYPVNPGVLFLIEGAGQMSLQANWGDGFATDAGLVRGLGLSDPNPFFQALLSKPYKNQVVISPHVYPASVTTNPLSSSGKPMWDRLSKSFGYLAKTGYKGKRFPIAVGEFGSTFAAPDQAFLRDWALYATNTGAAADGKHTPVQSWFYWSFNANSGDTGGIVRDDWRTIRWDKIGYLIKSFGLRPWYT